jgi:hypothetical protein
MQLVVSRPLRKTSWVVSTSTPADPVGRIDRVADTLPVNPPTTLIASKRLV